MTIHAWDVDSEPGHGWNGEYDGMFVDGTLLSPGYLQGSNNTWSTTVFDLPLSSIVDDGDVGVFLDIDMHTRGWLTTIDYSRIEIVYSLFANDPPYQPELDYSLTMIDDCFGGGQCAQNGQDLVIDVVGPTPADPDGDAVTYQYRWFVDVGTGGFIDDEFAGRPDHTGNTVPAADILPDDIWQVQVTPVDENLAVGNLAIATFPQFCPDQTGCNDPPIAICQDVTVDADANCEAMASVDNGSYDPDGDPVTTAQTPPGPYPIGTTTVTLRITDAGGLWDECTGTVTVEDNTPPVATCPGDMILDNDPGSCDAVVTFASSFTDNCPGGSIVCVPPSGSTFAVGVTTVTCTATDAAGNTDVCSFNVTVNDTEDPVATCMYDVTFPSDPGQCGVAVGFVATSTDNCPGVTTTYVPPSGSFFPVGITAVTGTATDAAGNTDVCSFNVTVNDTENPVATCPGDMILDNDPGSCDAVVTFASSFTDNCPGGSIVCVPSSGSTFAVGVTTVTCTATDAAGNTDVCSFNVTVNDTEDPVFDQPCPADVTVECDAVPTPETLTASDNCDQAPVVTFGEVDIPGSCAQEYTLTRTWTATDMYGNSTECVQVITVEDTTPPEFPPEAMADCNDTSYFPCGYEVDPAYIPATDNCDPDPVVTWQEIVTPGACPQEYSLEWIYTATDACGNATECRFWVFFIDTLAPVLTVPQDQTYFFCEAQEMSFSIISSDNCDPDPTPTVVDGPGVIVDGIWRYTPTVDEVSVVTVRCEDDCGNYTEDSFTVSFDFNSPPVLTCPGDAMVDWGSLYSGQAVAVDTDTISGQSTVVYTRTGGPTTVNVNPSTGAINWTPSATDMIAACRHTIEITATDSCGETDVCSFVVSLWNDTPEITCTEEVINMVWGYATGDGVSATDGDDGPALLTYFLASFSGPGIVNVDPGTGDWTWQTEEDVAYLGDFELCIGVHDGAAIGCEPPTNPDNADTCCQMIHVIPTADIVIQKTHDAYQGQYEEVSVTIENSPLAMGGFDFLIAYDASALNFTEATPGQLLEDCGWEYFTYRYGAFGNCGDACPSGLLRIIAIAETNNGPNHPSCYGPPDTDPYELVRLKFLVTDDRTFECQYAPMFFFWDDCGDNTIASESGDTLYLDRSIYDFENNLIWHEEDDDEFPEDARIPFVGAPDYCVNPDPDKPSAMRILDFTNGGVDIVCADSIDARGDINLNGQSNEIADATLFCNYFISGLEVFTVNAPGQIAASDVNADGIVLSVADLVYLIRIVVGDALPYARPVPAVPVDCRWLSDGTLRVADNTAIGAVALVVEGDASPRLLAENMQIKYSFDGKQTRILVYSLAGESFTGDFVQVNGHVVSFEMATAFGAPVNGKLMPTEFRLGQNFPNPFNPTTTIGFSVPTPGDYHLAIFNIVGRQVAEFAGAIEAGEHAIEWDATGSASGVYFYRLRFDDKSETRKMLLLK
jgi:hypothetical protein